MFDAGWRSSPSLNGHPNSWARAVAIVVFPLPEMPVIIRIVRSLAMSAWSAFNAFEVAPYSWSAQAGVLPGFRNRSVHPWLISPRKSLGMRTDRSQLDHRSLRPQYPQSDTRPECLDRTHHCLH